MSKFNRSELDAYIHGVLTTRKAVVDDRVSEAKNPSRSNSMRLRHQDPAYREKYMAGTALRNTSEATKRWLATPEGRNAFLAGRAKITKAVIDPKGVRWDKAADAAPVWFPNITVKSACRKIRDLIKEGMEWKYE